MNWLARVKKKNKGKDNKNVCTSKIQNNNPAVEYFDISSQLNEKEKVIVEMLYEYCQDKHIEQSIMKCNLKIMNRTIFDFILNFKDTPEKLRKLLEQIPYMITLKYVFDERYNYDEVINILCPNVSKIEHIDGMKDKKYTSDQIKYCIENEIFIPFYHDKFDYDEIDMLISKTGFVLENFEKKLIYKLEFDLLSKILSTYDMAEVIEIVQRISYLPINNFKIRVELIPLLIEKGFTSDEIKLLFLAIDEYKENQIAKINLFLSVSNKEELFKKLFRE